MSTFSPEVQVKGLEALQRAARVLPNETGKALKRAQGSVAPVIQRRARAHAPKDTGQLHASIQVDGPKGTRLDVVTRIFTNLKHAIYQEEGTGIYAGRGMIRPKNGRVMAWKKSGKWIFARRIRGVKPQRFMAKSAQENSGRYWSQIQTEIADVLRKLPK